MIPELHKQTLLKAIEYDPDRIIEFLDMVDWSLIEFEFNFIFNRDETTHLRTEQTYESISEQHRFT